MYGLLLEAMHDYISNTLSEAEWQEMVSLSGIAHSNFVTHCCYGESLIGQMAEAIAEMTGTSLDQVMERLGSHFVKFISRYGYETVLKVLGRDVRDFLNGLDNLHEYLRLSYPKMKAPSFSCDNETPGGLMLHYRSRRQGFTYYVIGQIRQVGTVFYGTDIEVEIVQNTCVNQVNHVILKLHFDNKGFTLNTNKTRDADMPTIRSGTFFRCFPFHVVFGRDMCIRHVGTSLQAALPDLVGKRLDHAFEMTKPLVDFTYENIMAYTNNIFYIHSTSQVVRRPQLSQESSRGSASDNSDDYTKAFSDSSEDEQDELAFHLRLKGQMKFVADWDAFIYLANPILNSLEKLYSIGLYLSDLSLHSASRDMVLIGSSRSKELAAVLVKARQKSKRLEDIIRLLDNEIKRSDSLLHQMIPKPIADRLRCGEDGVQETCQVMEAVTVLFSEVIEFNAICAKITPMEVVNILNSMYTRFDNLTEVHKVYKVETVGDVYMIVSGAPLPSRTHALQMSDMSLDMLDAVQSVPNPATENDHIQIKIGMHSGTVVAGIVGLKMPRYCLFGDTVNTAARMETNGLPMKIHVSASTKAKLEGYPYTVVKRDKPVELKGKGLTQTYWLKGRIGPGCTQLYEQSPKSRRSSLIDRALTRSSCSRPGTQTPRTLPSPEVAADHRPPSHTDHRNDDVTAPTPEVGDPPTSAMSGRQVQCNAKVCLLM